MTSEIVEILLRARNEASAGLKKVESDLKQLDKAVSKSLFSTGFDMQGNFLGAKQFAKDALPALNAQIEKWVILGASVEEITDTLLPDYIKKLNTAGTATETSVGATKKLAAAFAALGGVMALQQAAQFAVGMAQLNTQVERSTFAFEHFSGGAAQAAANLRAVDRASGGTLTTLEAQNVAVVGLTQGLASNSQELEKMTRIARGIVAVSPIINDVETAFSQLGLTIANQSMMRLDQLGTSAIEVRAKMAELKSATKGLTDEQAFQDALLSILETKFETLTDAAINQASGLEILRKAWIEYRITAAESFGWVDDIARRLGGELNVETQLRSAYRLIDNLPSVISSEQRDIISDIQSILDDPLGSADNWIDLGTQLDELIDKFYELGDARTNFFKGLTAGTKIEFPTDDPMFTTDQDQARLRSLEEAQKVIDKIIETQAQAMQVRVFEETGDIDKAAAAYALVNEQLSIWVERQKNSLDLPIAERLSTIINLLPSVASKYISLASTASESMEKTTDAVEKLASANDMLAASVGTAAAAMPALIRNMGTAQSAAINLVGAVGAAFDTMAKVHDGPLGFSKAQKGDVKKPSLPTETKQINSELAATLRTTSAVNDEFNSLKSTISGIVSGAIGPVAGVDANALLPREDAVNENARRLADIAVNGFTGQDWLDEFAMEAPDVFEQLKNSSDPKATAAQILKDFQDGLVPELLDKDRAKDLVRRALQGDENTKQLIDEIAADLANEFGISVGDAKAKASEVLGGGEGATGVSLAPKIDATAAESAASAFASSFNAAISGSTIGADLSGTIMTQVMASVAVIEASGNEAGKALVKGVTATFTDIPAAFIAAVAALVTPAVQASINQNGGRTGAAAV